MSEWNKLPDPKKYRAILVVDMNDDDKTPFVVVWNPNEKEWMIPNYIKVEFTHWIPMPDEPKDGEIDDTNNPS